MNTLLVVGTGIKFLSHLTMEVKVCIEKADRVLYLHNDPHMQEWIHLSNKNSSSLDSIYNKDNFRNQNYYEIAKYIIKELDFYKTVCLVTYGHPTVLVQPFLDAIELARKKKINIIVLPAISSDACLLADLSIDPGTQGIQSYETSDFLLYKRTYDISCHIILWQPYVIGLLGLAKNHDPKPGLNILANYLREQYSDEHIVYLYQAAQYPGFKPIIKKITLTDLPVCELERLSTIYLPPAVKKEIDENMLALFKKL